MRMRVRVCVCVCSLCFQVLFLLGYKYQLNNLLYLYKTCLTHYENTPIQMFRKILPKIEIFQINNADMFHNSPQNIDCGYSLEPPW